MGLLEQEIKELRLMNKQIMEGKIKPEEVHQRIAVYSQIEKRAKLYLSAMVLGAKHGAKGKGAMKGNLIGDGSIIDLGIDQEVDKVVCTLRGGITTRAECLDRSGAMENYPHCSECLHYGTTRKLLLERTAD